MRVIAKSTLRDFWEKYPDSEQQIKAWYRETERANWKTPTDIKNEYPTATVLRDKRIVFNICGNRYRLIVRINYDYGLVWIRFIGTHSDYDNINAMKV